MIKDKINIDVSEVKAFRECRRKWAFSSRNMMHLRAIETKLPLKMGTAFHKALERMYLGVDLALNEVFEELEIDSANAAMMELNLGGYYNNVLKHDLQKFAVVDTEHRFNIPLNQLIKQLQWGEHINITGSIDLVYRDRATGLVGGLEHKYLKNFRSDIYDALDEQPKLYYIAIMHDFDGICESININQIRKLKTKFDHMRTQLTYTEDQVHDFLEGFVNDVSAIDDIITYADCNHIATPSYMGCGMCDYAPLCLEMNKRGTSDITTLSEEFIHAQGLQKRLIDHLEEK